MDYSSTSQMTVDDAKRSLLNLEPDPPTDNRTLLDSGFELLRQYPLAGLAVAGLAGVLLARSPWLRKSAIKTAAGLLASRIL